MSWLIGRTTDTASKVSLDGNYKYSARVYNPTAGNIDWLAALVDIDATGAGVFKLAIFADSGGAAGAQLGITNELSVAAGSGKAWASGTLTSTVSLAAATWYHIAIHTKTNYVNLYQYGSGGSSDYNYDYYPDGTANPWGTHSAGSIDRCLIAQVSTANVAPNAPTLLGPVGGVNVDVSLAQEFTWAFSDNDAGDTQSARNLRYRISGTSTWTTLGWVDTPYGSHTFAGATFVEGNTYEWQGQTKDALGLEGPWSSSATFVAVANPGSATFTDPTNNQTITTASYTMTWSISAQDDYQARRVKDTGGSPDTGTIYEDTGTVSGASVRTKTWTLTTNNRTEHWQVRVRKSGVWGAYASVKVNIAFTAPATPTAVATAKSSSGYIEVAVTHPTPAGGQPTVVAQEIWRTTTGLAADAIRVAKDMLPGATFKDWLAYGPGVTFSYFARAVGSTGATADSALAS